MQTNRKCLHSVTVSIDRNRSLRHEFNLQPTLEVFVAHKRIFRLKRLNINKVYASNVPHLPEFLRLASFVCVAMCSLCIWPFALSIKSSRGWEGGTCLVD